MNASCAGPVTGPGPSRDPPTTSADGGRVSCSVSSIPKICTASGSPLYCGPVEPIGQNRRLFHGWQFSPIVTVVAASSPGKLTTRGFAVVSHTVPVVNWLSPFPCPSLICPYECGKVELPPLL